MSGTWMELKFDRYKFKCRYDCNGKIFFKLASPSARVLLREDDEGAFNMAKSMCVQHWKGYGREAVYQPTVPGSWV